MRWLPTKEVDEYWLVSSGGDNLNKFRGSLQNELSLIDDQIQMVLEELNCKTYKKSIGKNIEELLHQINQNQILKNFKSNRSVKLKLLNKIRVYCAHGISFVGEQGTILLLNNRENALFFDELLVNEMEKLSDECMFFIMELQIFLGLTD